MEKFLNKVQTADSASEVDGMALAGMLSSQIIHHQFVEAFCSEAIPIVQLNIVVDKRSGARHGIAEMPSRPREAVGMPIASRR